MNSGEQIKDRDQLRAILSPHLGNWNRKQYPTFRVPISGSSFSPPPQGVEIDLKYVEFRYEEGFFEGKRVYRIIANGVIIHHGDLHW